MPQPQECDSGTPKNKKWFTCVSAGLLMQAFTSVSDFNEDCVPTYRYLWIAAYYNERASTIVRLRNLP